MSAPTYMNDTGSCEVALRYLGEGVQPCALELGQHEKNGRPVQADCEAIEAGTRLGRWLSGPSAPDESPNNHLPPMLLVGKKDHPHSLAPSFWYLTAAR